MMRDYNKRILVAGATFGMGRSAAVALAREGASLILVGHDKKLLEATVRDVAANGPRPDSILADLSIQSEVRRVAETVAAEEPSLDVLINVAGANHSPRVLTPDGIERTFAVNVVVPFLLSTLLYCRLSRKGGRIVNIVPHLRTMTWPVPDSLVDPGSFSGYSAYSQTKLALLMVTREQAIRYCGTGIAVVALHPGIMPEQRFGGEGSPSICHVSDDEVRLCEPRLAWADKYISAALGPHDTGSLLSDGGGVSWPVQTQDPEARRKLWCVLEKLARRP